MIFLKRGKQLSLSSAPLYTSLFAIVTLGLFIGTFWAYSEYESYRDSVVNIRRNYRQQYGKRVLEEAEKVIDFIEYKRLQQSQRMELEIRDKVQSAYSIASHVYSLYHEEQNIDELREMVVELLRPIRWDNGLGYYFAGRVSSGRIDLLADKPHYEGKNLLHHEDQYVRQTIAAIIEVVRDRGAGQLNYNWSKPKSAQGLYPKITFVKHFPPFDWFIGAGVYVDEMQSRTQHDILDRINSIRFGVDGEVLVFRNDSTIIGGRKPWLFGRSIAALRDVEGASYGSRMLELIDGGNRGGFIEYVTPAEGRNGTARRLCYVRLYEDWNWAVAASLSMVDMEQAIAFETEAYKKIAFQNTALFLVLLGIAVTGILFMTYFYSLRIKSGIAHFNEFFRKAVDSKVRVEKDQLNFKEFAILGEYANRMNDDRLAKEKVIERDERRLDSLLRLGFMESSRAEELFDFTLTRIIEIVESRSAYLATVEEGQIELRSLVVREEGVCRGIDPDGIPIRRKDDAIDRIVATGRMVFDNSTTVPAAQTFHAITEPVCCRIDVPVFEQDRLVAVLGLCNKAGGYDEDDVRQTVLLLEGMWLHHMRIANRKEMRRLRQLLRDITDSMPSVLIGIDSDFRVMQWNRLACQQTGIAEGDALGRPLTELLPEMEKYAERIGQVVATGRQEDIRRIPVETDEGTRYQSITVFPLKSGDTPGAVLRLDDVTEWVAMEEMMVQSEKMLSIGSLAAGIAHEINNPLASVTQGLQVIRRRLSGELPANREAAESIGIDLDVIGEYLEKRGISTLLDIIDGDSSRAARLVHNMLAFSRKKASRLVSCDIRQLLDDALNLGLADYDLKNNYDFRQICINKDYPEAAVDVECDSTSIQQVFLNIIRNSAHAIALNRENITTPEMTLRIKKEEELARIEIEDNGIGMDSVTRKKIFEPFFTTKKIGEGTGLGLAISYYIIAEQHRGVLKVYSKPGKGSLFVIHLPLSQG